MKKLLCICLTMVLLLSLCLSVSAANDDEIVKDGVIYKSYQDRYWAVVGYTDDLPAVVTIPDSVDGMPVN